MFNNKSVLITGATGSFGNRCVRRILEEFKPRRLIIFSRDELKQFEMEQTLRAEYGDEKCECLRFFLGDVRDIERLKLAFRGVDYVIHAAALKQVVAAEYNPMEFVKTNIHGAENVSRAAVDCGVEKVVALSTDKAANPANLYGATKLASDKIFVAANSLSGAVGPRFSVVRYGNVIGSRGSVVPFFKKLVEEGAKELPVTHADMTRFWIPLDEGVDLVFNAFKRMWGGEIYVPKIPSMRILDLVEAIAPGMPHKIVGIRPGEKLHELMVGADAAHLTVEFDDHYVIQPGVVFNYDDGFESYATNRMKEKGKPVPEGFEYESGTNPHFLSVEELRKGC